MKILFLSAYFFPENSASPYLGRTRNQAFADAGFTMTAYAPTPCRGIDEETRAKYKKIKYEILYDGALELHRFPLYKEGKNTIGRALRYTICWIQHLYFGLKSKNVDVVFLSSTPPIQGLIGAMMKKFRKIPFIYNLQDIFPDSLVGTGLARKNGFLWKIGRRIEDLTYKYADKIIVISQDFKKNLLAKGVPEDKIELIYNWVEQDAVINIPRENNKLIKKYNLDPSKFIISYCGNIGLTQNMDMLLEIAQDLSEIDKIHFILIGEGAYKSEVDKIIQEKNIKNVTLLPFQKYEDISHVFSLGDIGLVISKPGVGNNSVPSKTWSIMSASRPVLANFDPNELKNIICDNECGIFTEAGDKDSFKDAILFLYQHPDLCKRYGEGGRKFVMNNLTRESGTRKLVNLINGLKRNNEKNV